MKILSTIIGCALAFSPSIVSAATYSCDLGKTNMLDEKVSIGKLEFITIPDSQAVTLKKFNKWTGLKTMQATFDGGKVSFSIPTKKDTVLHVSLGDRGTFASVTEIYRPGGAGVPIVDMFGSGKCELLSQ